MPAAQHPIHAQFEKAFNAGDLEALVALYEPGAVYNLPTGPVQGLDAIREVYRSVLAMKPQIRVETLEVLDTGDGLAMLRGQWKTTVAGPDGPAETEGQSCEVIRESDGSWRFVIDNPWGD